MQAKPLPKFGEWDVNDPSSAEDFSIIFNKARTEKKLGSQTDSLSKPESLPNHAAVLGKPPSVSLSLFYAYLQRNVCVVKLGDSTEPSEHQLNMFHKHKQISDFRLLQEKA